MSRLIFPNAVADEHIDVSWLVGRQLEQLTSDSGHSWLFEFGSGTHLTVECLWRIVHADSIMLTSEDHGQQFGLPTTVDAGAAGMDALGSKMITLATVQAGTADFLIEFGPDTRLEIISTSTGYESWKLQSPTGKSYVAQGGGRVCEWSK